MLRSVTTDSSSKLQQINEKIKGECEELTTRKERLTKEKEELDDKINNLTKDYNHEKKEREQLEKAVEHKNNEIGLNLSSLRKKLQSYVWEDMNAWNALLEIKTDIYPEDFHHLKMGEIIDLPYVDQIGNLNSDLEIENARLVELQLERQREQAKDLEMDDDILNSPKKDETKKEEPKKDDTKKDDTKKDKPKKDKTKKDETKKDKDKTKKKKKEDE